MGRPKSVQDGTKLTVYVDGDVRDRIYALSEKTGLSVNVLARNLISASLGEAEFLHSLGVYSLREWFDKVRGRVHDGVKG